MDTQVEQITQTKDGTVEVVFAPQQVSRLSLTRSMSHIGSCFRFGHSSSNFKTHMQYHVSHPSSRCYVPHEIETEQMVDLEGIHIS